MAATTLSIVQRIGGRMITTLCALFLASALRAHRPTFGLDAWAKAFLLLAALHVLMIAVTSRLPLIQER